MTKELSALLDGELEVHEEPMLWATLKADPRLRESWQSYKLVGDAIRNEQDLARDITGRVMAALADEPVVMAPKPKRGRAWSNLFMAMAASVAGVAVVGWLAFALQTQQGDAPVLAQNKTPPTVAAASPSASQEIQEYVLAHQANAPGLHLQGGTQHIRTVSAVGPAK